MNEMYFILVHLVSQGRKKALQNLILFIKVTKKFKRKKKMHHFGNVALEFTRILD